MGSLRDESKNSRKKNRVHTKDTRTAHVMSYAYVAVTKQQRNGSGGMKVRAELVTRRYTSGRGFPKEGVKSSPAAQSNS